MLDLNPEFARIENFYFNMNVIDGKMWKKLI